MTVTVFSKHTNLNRFLNRVYSVKRYKWHTFHILPSFLCCPVMCVEGQSPFSSHFLHQKQYLKHLPIMPNLHKNLILSCQHFRHLHIRYDMLLFQIETRSFLQCSKGNTFTESSLPTYFPKVHTLDKINISYMLFS